MTDWQTIVKPAKGDIRAITPATATTTDSYADAVDLDTRWMGDTIITIANTGSTNQLDYQVLVYNDYANGTAHTTTTNTVATVDTDQIILVRHARAKVQVKSTVGSSHTNYQVDAITGR